MVVERAEVLAGDGHLPGSRGTGPPFHDGLPSRLPECLAGLLTIVVDLWYTCWIWNHGLCLLFGYGRRAPSFDQAAASSER